MTSGAKIVLVAIAGSFALVGLALLLGGESVGPPIEGSADESLYNPVRAGEKVPFGFRQLLPRDAIRPVYEPTFVSAADAQWDDGSLVIGLEIDGDAKAYPVGYLNRREIVNDHIGKTPVLVTW